MPRSSRFQSGVSGGFAVGVGDQNALALLVDGALVRLVVAEHPVQHARTAGVGEELALIADQAARGGDEADARLAGARGAHVLQLRLTGRQLFDDDAGELVVHVDHHVFDGLETRAGLFVLLVNHARARDGDLETFAAHAFDQHAELQFATARDFIGVLVDGFGDADGDVGLGFLQQAVADDAALNLVAFLAGEGAVVDADGHGDGRRVDGLGGQGARHFHGAQGVGHGGFRQARDGDDVARLDASSTG